MVTIQAPGETISLYQTCAGKAHISRCGFAALEDSATLKTEHFRRRSLAAKPFFNLQFKSRGIIVKLKTAAVNLRVLSQGPKEQGVKPMPSSDLRRHRLPPNRTLTDTRLVTLSATSPPRDHSTPKYDGASTQ